MIPAYAEETEEQRKVPPAAFQRFHPASMFNWWNDLQGSLRVDAPLKLYPGERVIVGASYDVSAPGVNRFRTGLYVQLTTIDGPITKIARWSEQTTTLFLPVTGTEWFDLGPMPSKPQYVSILLYFNDDPDATSQSLPGGTGGWEYLNSVLHTIAVSSTPTGGLPAPEIPKPIQKTIEGEKEKKERNLWLMVGGGIGLLGLVMLLKK